VVITHWAAMGYKRENRPLFGFGGSLGWRFFFGKKMKKSGLGVAKFALYMLYFNIKYKID